MKHPLTPYLLLFLFALVLYGNTLTHDYALDDTIVITKNTFTFQGIRGIDDIFRYESFTGFFGVQKDLVVGGRYRPLSIASFALEYAVLGDLYPGFSHFLNILFYALTGMLIFSILKRLFRSSGKESLFLALPFITALLFLAHPLHSEVVANIKGRDEIFALLFSLLALYFTLRYFDSHNNLYLAGSFISLFLGLLSKENAIMFVVIIPLTLWFFTGKTLKECLRPTIPLVVAAILFIWIRYLVLGYINLSGSVTELLNNPFLQANPGEKAGTILYTMLIYLKLLVFPFPLTHDYYPYHIPLVPLTSVAALVSLATCLGLLIYAVAGIKTKSIVSYGILYYFLTLFIVSNILFAVGTFMNERFIYMPSFGFVLIMAWLLTTSFWSTGAYEHIQKQTKAHPGGKDHKRVLTILQRSVLLLFLIGFSLLTISRNRAWKDDFTLFTTDVLVSENSTKCNTSAGGQLIERAQTIEDSAMKQAMFDRAISYLQKALDIYPGNKSSLLLLGNASVYAHQDIKGALDYYLTILRMDPAHKDAMTNALKVLKLIDSRKDAAYQVDIANKLRTFNPAGGELNYFLGVLYARYMGNIDTALYYMHIAEPANLNNAGFYKDLGVIYAIRGDFSEATSTFEKALSLDPNDQAVKQNLQMIRDKN